MSPRTHDAHAVPCFSPSDAKQHRFFGIELDSERGARYWLTYEAVYAYALAPDQQPAGRKDQLPPKLVSDPADECEATARPARPRPRQPNFSPPAAKRSSREKRRRTKPKKKKVARPPRPRRKSAKKSKKSLPLLCRQDGKDSDSETEATASATESEDGLAEDFNAELVRILRTDPKDWKRIGEGKTGREIRPIEYVPRPEDSEFRQPDDTAGEYFNVKITEVEVAKMKDGDGDIRFEKVAEHLLPKFKEGDYFEFLAARMQSYMTHLIRTIGCTPRYYKPSKDKVILIDHIARMFGVQHGRMFRGHPSVKNTFSTRELLDEVGPASESLPRDGMQDMHRCMHFGGD